MRETASCFRRYLDLRGIKWKPFDTGLAKGYLVEQPASLPSRPARSPVMIIPTGADALCEEMWQTGGRGAFDRGSHVVLVDGPGQGHIVRDPSRGEEDRYMDCAKWAAAMEQVVDMLEREPRVDSRRIVLLGRSFAGNLGLHAAVRLGPRLCALALDPPQADYLGMRAKLLAGFEKQAPGITEDYAQGRAEAFEAKFAKASGLGTSWSKTYFWQSRMGTYSKRGSAFAMLNEMGRMHVADAIPKLSNLPLWVTAFAGENISQGSDAHSFRALSATQPITVAEFTRQEGAIGHCEQGANALFDERLGIWLAGVFAAVK